MKSTESKTLSDRREGRQKLAAVMFADMVEYSKHLAEQDDAGDSIQAARAIDLFKALIRRLRRACRQRRGRRHSCAVRPAARPGAAVRSSIQAEFRDQSVWGDGANRSESRIGLNLGEVAVHEGNVHGHCVNVASRN